MPKRKRSRKNTAQRPVIGPGGYGPGVEELRESSAGSPIVYGPEGYKTWQDNPSAEETPSGIRKAAVCAYATNLPEDVLRNLQAQSPGLAERLAEGLTQDQLGKEAGMIAQALEDAGAPPGAYSFSQGDPESGSKIIVGSRPEPGKIPAGFQRTPRLATTSAKVITAQGGHQDRDLPVGMQAGDLIATEQPAGYADAGIDLPESADFKPGSRVWRPVSGEAAQLAARVREMLDSGMSSEQVADAIDQSLTPRMQAVHIPIGKNMAAGGGDEHLHPSLRGLSPDDDVPVIITSAGDEPPEGAGELLGVLSRSMHTPSGHAWPAGAKVWRNLNPEPIDPDDPRTTELIIDLEDSVIAATVRTRWAPEDVLNRHARLAQRYADREPLTVSYLTHLLNAAWDGDPEQAARMHWPVPAGERGAAEGHLLARLVARQLRDALTYQVTAGMRETMHESEELLPGVQRLNAGDLPAPVGFAWLDDPWPMPLVDGPLPVRAVSWEKTTAPILDEPSAGLPVDCVRLVFWVHMPDVLAYGYFNEDDPKVLGMTRELGDLMPHHVSLLPLGYRFGLKPGATLDESLSMIALVHSLWTFLGMELSASKTVRPSSPAHSKRILRSIKHDRVHVITLRRISYISDGSGLNTGRLVNRTCKWWVADFCRHIDPYRDEDENGRPRRHQAIPAERMGSIGEDDEHDVCSVCLDRGQTVRITLVRGHRRGPSHLPWKTPASGRTVYRLAR